jgi:hypothetical protein
VITGAAVVPHPPLLLREVGGLVDPVAELRTAARAAVEAVVAGDREPDEVVTVGGADLTRWWPATAGVDPHPFAPALRGPAAEALPLSLGVGLRLLTEAGWAGHTTCLSVAWDAPAADLETLAASVATRPGRTVMLVLGDGSACRGEKAPGYLDERAFPFDDALAKALGDGDAAALMGLDTALAGDLMAFGRAAFRFLGALALRQPAPARASLTHREDPFGVSYFTAVWRF